jgi:FkbM family methyltransferase
MPRPVSPPVPRDKPLEARHLLTVVALFQRYLPYGKGAVPRWLGQRFAQDYATFMTTRHGAKLVMASDSYDVYATMRLNGNAWDYHDFKICRDATYEGDVFYDIGANVGYMAIEMAAVNDDTVRVIAFEPQTRLATAIALSGKLNGFRNLTVFDCLVGNCTQLAELFIAPASIHASGVADSGRPSVKRLPKLMARIDDLVQSGMISPPDMIKMDVEGCEHLVLQGASKTLSESLPHIFLEYIAEFDVGGRVRRAVMALVEKSEDYFLYGHLRAHLQSKIPSTYITLNTEGSWDDIDAVFIRNVKRKLRDDLQAALERSPKLKKGLSQDGAFWQELRLTIW